MGLKKIAAMMPPHLRLLGLDLLDLTVTITDRVIKVDIFLEKTLPIQQVVTQNGFLQIHIYIL